MAPSRNHIALGRLLVILASAISLLIIGVSCQGESDAPGALDGPVASVSAAASVATAQLYSNPQYQSPVRGDPGDVLLIPGTNFLPPGTTWSAVVYQALTDTTLAPVHPASIPTGQTATLGVIRSLAVDIYGSHLGLVEARQHVDRLQVEA